MKSQDLVVLLKLVSLEQAKNEGDAHPGEAAYHDDPYSVRSLESALGISKTEVNASINRTFRRDSRSKIGNPATQSLTAAISIILWCTD
ncbi:hypothetical protein [Bradyrhizobium zhanjiangense]|uniref:hypothetical protein n=1 Tax=Bradyrhizobium zhanjiangense TaxID=1325107 RepID=UPI001FE1ABC0|nr:hypothetical protein [Bradyrhizobium zhanjiangense]